MTYITYISPIKKRIITACRLLNHWGVGISFGGVISNLNKEVITLGIIMILVAQITSAICGLRWNSYSEVNRKIKRR